MDKEAIIWTGLGTIVMLLFFFVRPDYLMIVTWIALSIFLFIKYRSFFYKLMISTGIATTWMVLGRNMYGYNHTYLLTIGGVQIFTLLAWSLGMFSIYIVFLFSAGYFGVSKTWKRFVMYTLIFWVLLIVGEVLGYHVFMIRNAATGMYPGLPICDCIHAPHWMQAVYFSLGPIFFGLLKFFRLEKVNFK